MAGRIVCQVHRFPAFDSMHTESLWSIRRIYRILKHIVRVIKQIFYEKKKEKEEILAGEDFPSRLLWRTPFKIHDAIVCDMCYHVRKMNYFPRKGQFNKSRNFTSNYYYTYYKRWHGLAAYLPAVIHYHTHFLLTIVYTYTCRRVK